MSLSPGGTRGSKMNSLPLLALLVLVLGLSVYLGLLFSPHQDVMHLPETPGVKFMKQKAIEVKGDYSKLSPADQKLVEQYSNRHGPMSIAIYYRISQKGN